MRFSAILVLLATLILPPPATAQSHKRPLSKAPLSGDDQVAKPEPVAEMVLASPAFVEGGRIPDEYTCDGADFSPPLVWSNAPEGTRAFVLVCEDPDAPGGTWLHWLLVDVPGRLRAWDAGLSDGVKLLPDPARHGLNSWGRAAWGGPCPPRGPAHRYEFTLYALSSTLDLREDAPDLETVRDALRGLVLAEARLTGLFSH